jgi:hypothetical protein
MLTIYLFIISGKKPKIVVRPKEKIEVNTGLIFLLTCQATGIPPPRIQCPGPVPVMRTVCLIHGPISPLYFLFPVKPSEILSDVKVAYLKVVFVFYYW